MPAFEASRESRIVRALNRAYRTVRGGDQPTGAIAPPGFYGTDAGHLYQRGGMEGVVCGPGGRYNTMPGRAGRDRRLSRHGADLLVILVICGVA